VKKNVQIFVVVVGVVILFSSAPNLRRVTDNADARQLTWAWLSQIFSDVSEQMRCDWEHGSFRSDQSRFVRFWKRMQPLFSTA